MERKEDPTTSSSDFQRSDSWSLSDQELKSVYSKRATLQEVGIFLVWLIAFLFQLVFKGTGWRLFSRFFRTDFSIVWTKKSRLIKDLVGQVLASGYNSIRGRLRPGWELLCG